MLTPRHCKTCLVFWWRRSGHRAWCPACCTLMDEVQGEPWRVTRPAGELRPGIVAEWGHDSDEDVSVSGGRTSG